MKYDIIECMGKVNGIACFRADSIHFYSISKNTGEFNCEERNHCMKILVVDDERTLVKGIKFNLQNGRYQPYFKGRRTS